MRRLLALLVAAAVTVAGIIYFRQLPPVEQAKTSTATGTSEKNPATAEAVSPQQPAASNLAASATVAATPSAIASANSSTPSIPSGTFAPYVPSAAAGAPLEFTNIPPQAVVDAMRITIHSYASMFRQNPVGNNQEITAALTGKNPRQANFMNPEAGMRINADGELVDPWGTPYFFHALAATEMEIRSAGPDKKMWTPDDIMAK